MYKRFLKNYLFRLEPEKAHHFTVQLLNIVMSIPIISHLFSWYYNYQKKGIEKYVMGLKFKNPVGLAAGFDKDGKLIQSLKGLGFGFIEIGTVTPEPQEGNAQPRLYRLPADEALINRMGFNNDGVEAMAQRLQTISSGDLIIGGNIGRNKSTPNAHAIKDYQKCFNTLFPYVHYFAVNVSSPNTVNLRELQDKEPLSDLLQLLQMLNYKQSKPKPILLKISPDLNKHQLQDIAEILRYSKIDGVIATNTTVSRENLTTPDHEIEKMGKGGLSGKPLQEVSTEFIRSLRELLGPEAVIIGVGGIHNEASAIEKLEAGADLIQLYTGLVYEGPGLVKRICRAIAKKEWN